jgi:hypothetical protein
VEQKDGELTIKGLSPNESSVTRFGQSLEFSSGLFTNLNIETQREAMQTSGAVTVASESNVALTEVIAFTVKCSYGAKPQAQSAAPSASNQVAMKK